MQCRFIDTGFSNAYTNMAIDESLLEYCKLPTLRVYGWEPSAVSVGYNQNIQKEVNAEKCRELNIDIVRRITGGKAVFHDKEATYSFILPENNNILPKSINESYRIIANALVIALRKIKIKADIRKVTEKIASPICFNSSNWYELIVNNKKISGSAQRRINFKMLQHGNILIDFDYKKNCLLFNTDNAAGNPEKMKKRITSLNSELKREITSEEIYSAIKIGFEENFGFDFFDDSLTREEMELTENLSQGKYLRDGRDFYETF